MKTATKRRLAYLLGGLLATLVGILVGIRLRYGGGEPYPDLSTAPLVGEAELDVVVELDMPPGNVAISSDGRVFFNIHPFAAPARFDHPSLFELVDGEPRPYPSAAYQATLQGSFGMTVDDHERLWLVETAALDHESTRLVAFDLARDEPVFEHVFEPGVARFAQDLRVSHDGRYIVLADTGAFRFTEPALLVFDTVEATVVREFSGHDSLRPQDWLMRVQGQPYTVGWGLLSFAVGVDGVALGPRVDADGGRDEWVYYATMTHDTLYRIPLSALLDASYDMAALAASIETIGAKPMSDGIALDAAGNVLVTDVEHGGVARITPTGARDTLVSDGRVIWADGIATMPDGDVVFTDSAIPAYIRQDLRPPSRARLAAAAPFAIYRFTPPAR